jgi:fluoroacetyl-CoA thioesterase
MPSVFATAFMVAFVEATCIEAVRDHLSEGEYTVGTLINLSHLAPTPPGMIVKTSVNLVEIKDRSLRFSVAVWDEKEVISDGWHERAIIDMSRFMAKVAKKSEFPS